MAKIIGSPLPNLPWEDKPAACKDVVWRSSLNPIVPKDAIPCANSIFNSAVVPFEGEFAGVFRVDNREREMRIHAAHSKDGVHWDIQPEPIDWQCDIPEIANFEYGYDPRVCWLEDRYWVTWCNGYMGYPTIGMAWTLDFKTYHQIENSYLPFNRNGVLFPRKIKGNSAMLSRPSDNGHTPFGDIFYSESPDLTFWGKHRLVMRPTGGWQSKKIGAGPIPIETDEGWLMIYHGVLNSCNGFVYSFGAALLDLDEPWKVIVRGAPYLLHPSADYERTGDVPNVAFPCAALVDAPTDRITLYYGGADTVICMAHSYVNDIIDYIKANPVK